MKKSIMVMKDGTRKEAGQRTVGIVVQYLSNDITVSDFILSKETMDFYYAYDSLKTRYCFL